MYNLTIVSRCIKKSKENTREILDAYGIRIGQKTWTVRISETGKKVLFEKLSSSATKNTAVAVYDNKSIEPIAIFGSKKYFFHGQTSIETESEEEDNISYLQKFHRKIISTAAYLHDIGKSSTIFQEYIKSKNKASAPDKKINHDFFSFLIFHSILEHIEKGEELSFSIKPIKIDTKKLSFVDIVSLLILSHHKMFFRNKNLIKLNIENKKDIYNGYSGKIDHCFSKEQIQNLVSRIKNDLQEIKHMADNLKISPSTEFLEYIIQEGRLCIMVADHNMSKQAIENEEENLKNIKPDDILAKSKGYGSQELFSHLKEVEEESIKIYDTLHSALLPGISKNSIQSLIAPTSNEKFKWQNQALNILTTNHNPKNGLFSVITSSTGSGKTIGVAKICLGIQAHNDENIRFTTALGLRNLTLQTGDEYGKIINENSVLTQIGSKIAKQLNSDGIDDNEDIGIPPSFAYSNGENIISKTFHSTLKGPISNDYITYPAVVSTIDYLITGTDFRTSSFIFSHLRIMNSDLILDEVDGYNLEDLKTIIRLCYLTGLYGKRIYLSTATASPAIIEALFNGYYNGYSAYCSAYKKENKIDTFFISNYKQKNSSDSIQMFKEICDTDSFNDFNSTFIKSIIETQTDIQQRKVEIRDISIKKGTFWSSILELHNNNSEKHNDSHCSVGMIRVAKIYQGFELLSHLRKTAQDYEKTNPNIKINIVFYHGKMFLGTRSYLEKAMDIGLNRKKDKNGQFPKHINNILFKKTLKDESIEQVINIFIVTPIEEVGRDHDFDWAIVEPSSVRSIIQTIGRVNRHRFIDYSNKKANVFIMKENFNLQSLSKKNALVYSMPGYESQGNIFEDQFGNRDFKSLFISKNGSVCDFNAFEVMNPSSTLSILEKEIINQELLKYLKAFNITAAKASRLSCDFKNKEKCGVFTDFRSSLVEEDTFILGEDKNNGLPTLFKYNSSFEKEEMSELYEKKHYDHNSYNFNFIDLNEEEYINKINEKVNDPDELWSVKQSQLKTNEKLLFSLYLGVIKMKNLTKNLI